MNRLLEEVIKQTLNGNLDPVEALEKAWELGIEEGAARQRVGMALNAEPSMEYAMEWHPDTLSPRQEAIKQQLQDEVRSSIEVYLKKLCKRTGNIAYLASATWVKEKWDLKPLPFEDDSEHADKK